MIKFFLYIYLFLFNFTYSDYIDVKKKSILVANYYNNKNYSISLNINKSNYRESSLLPFNDGLFSLELSPGKYNINLDCDNYNYNLIEGLLIKNKINNLKDFKITNKFIKIGDFNYFHKNKHKLSLISMINLIGFDNVFNYSVIINFDNKIIYQKEKYKSTFKYFDTILTNSGYHTLSIFIKSNTNMLCSCPSINSGFLNGRIISLVIESVKENELNNILSFGFSIPLLNSLFFKNHMSES